MRGRSKLVTTKQKVKCITTMADSTSSTDDTCTSKTPSEDDEVQVFCFLISGRDGGDQSFLNPRPSAQARADFSTLRA